MVLEPSNAENRYNDMVIKELQNIREDIKEVRKDVKCITITCGKRAGDCNKTFLPLTTFWRIITLGIVVLVGSYTYSSVVLSIILKHIAGA